MATLTREDLWEKAKAHKLDEYIAEWYPLLNGPFGDVRIAIIDDKTTWVLEEKRQ